MALHSSDDMTARKERESTLEEERARIARDLHDGPAQDLYVLAPRADMSRQHITPQPPTRQRST